MNNEKNVNNTPDNKRPSNRKKANSKERRSSEAELQFNSDGTVMSRTERLAMQKKQKGKKKKRALTALLAILLVFAVIIGAVAIFVNSKLNKLDIDTNDPTGIDPSQEFYVDPDETLNFSDIDDAAGNDYKAILKSWATNGGEKMSSKNVLNILLIGSDATSEEAKRAHQTDKGNTDVIMMVSVDKLNKKIKLTSFMRDSYTYLDGFERYAKINAACANGGASYLVETIENDYKIKIDGYAMVDFDSFREVIDILGGVNLDVPAYLKKYINVPTGENVLLNSQQALEFCRVRASDADGDISRVARQRQVINAIIGKCKGASLSDINSVMDAVLNNIKTNISKKAIVGYATQAVTNGWANYEIVQVTMPTADARSPHTSGPTGWIWIVDYPLAAQNLQKELYGETNIKLDENRKTAISIMGKRPQG